MLENNHKSFENKILPLKNELKGLKCIIQEVQLRKQAIVKENDTLKSKI